MIYAYDKVYLGKARANLACMLDYAVNVRGQKLRDFWNAFLTSDISGRCAAGESSVIAGSSGIELAERILNDCNGERIVVEVREEKSPEYWAGWALAYYQWSRNLSFDNIDRIVPIENIVRMYFPYHEMDIRQFCDRMDELMKKDRAATRLKTRRQLIGMTQKELSEETGVPLRTVQQYEQGQKNINAAKSEYIVAFSKALYCSPEELLEQM